MTCSVSAQSAFIKGRHHGGSIDLTLFTTVLTQLVLVVSQGTVQRREFSQLISLVIVLPFRCRRGLPKIPSISFVTT